MFSNRNIPDTGKKLKTYRRRIDRAALIVNFGASWKWVVDLLLWSLHSQYPLALGSVLYVLEKRKLPCSYRESNRGSYSL